MEDMKHFICWHCNVIAAKKFKKRLLLIHWN